ncbi:properdin-like [Oscarella lobularis]|uniref:properdin-like n=1 Tax=Oscarella lobularis TaxID=121494 RepID=UPI00331396B7
MRNRFILLLLSLVAYQEAAKKELEGICWQKYCGVTENVMLTSRSTFSTCCFTRSGGSWKSSNYPCQNCSTASLTSLTSWGEWTSWKTCVDCVQKRFRACRGLFEGDCERGAKQTDSRPCKSCLSPTSSTSQWSDWKAIMECSRSCGGGIRVQLRSCLSRSPCHGLFFNIGKCNQKPCPVPVRWSDWSSWSPCSKTCGEGIRSKKRKCINPSSDDECKGHRKERERCNTKPCQSPGGWSEWVKSGPCSRSCGQGTQIWVRHCTNPIPQHGGNHCGGHSRAVRPCCYYDCPYNKYSYSASHRVAEYYRNVQYHYNSCGFLDWGRCRGTSYHLSLRYYTAYRREYRTQKGLTCR